MTNDPRRQKYYRRKRKSHKLDDKGAKGKKHPKRKGKGLQLDNQMSKKKKEKVDEK